MEKELLKDIKISKKLLFVWPTRTISYAVASTLLGFVTYFATDFLGISPVTAGLIFMISKIFDGFTDIVAGYLIDRTHTKLGKGRPYELALIGYWVSIVLLFCAPDMGVAPSCIYLFIMYSMINSVFLTLLNCSETVYLSNALDKPEHSVTVSAVTGFISLVFTMAAAIILPQMVASMGTSREGWRIISLLLAVPFTLLGLVRFLVIKEKHVERLIHSNKITVKSMLTLLSQNKYILLFAAIILFSNIGSSIVNNVTTYYYLYIMNDIGLASIMSLSMLAIIIVIIIVPVLSKKFGFVKIMRATTFLGMVGYLLRLIDLSNIGLLFLSNVLGMMGFYTLFAFVGTFVIDCIDYGEWKTGIRSEGTISCAQSVTSKIGTALGAGSIGLFMGLSGYNGELNVQSTSANMMIVILFSVIPAVFCLLQLILLKFYNLDKLLPKIREDLKMRRDN